jgi:integrase
MTQRRAKGEGSLIRRKGCRFWYASFYDATGHQVRISTKKEVKQEALHELRRLMGNSERGMPAPNAKIAYADIRAGLVSNYVERGNKSLRVLADGTESVVGLRQLDAYCGYEAAQPDKPGKPGIPVVRITTDFARAFARKRTAEGVGSAMVNRSLQCLRRMLNIAHEDGKVAVVPKIRLLKEPPARKGFLDLAKFEELLKALPEHLQPLILFLYWCGVRVGEALQIEWRQVDLNRALITLEEDQTKNSEARVIPLPDVLVERLRKINPQSGLVFDGTNLRTEWATACAAVGLGTIEDKTSEAGWDWQKYTGLNVHDFRRSAVRNLRLAGVAENESMKISGHKTRAVFDRYNIVSTEDVQAAMRKREALSTRANAQQQDGAKLVQSAPKRKAKLLKA